MQTALQGDFSLQRVAQELRTQWPEAELRKRDQLHRQSGFMRYEASDDEADMHAGENEESSLLAAGMGEEGMALIAQSTHRLRKRPRRPWLRYSMAGALCARPGRSRRK